ncbi:Src homology 2 (SH2) domain containing protein, partial [Euroglyphus maynei]
MTQTIWYLPHINRATVVHYLQRKAVGVFIVRQSSKPNTMAVSVRLPQGRGPHVEHYLIEKIIKAPVSASTKSTTVFRLEGSEHYFNSMLQLVLHYAQCQDELPIQLNLPSVLLNSSRSQLTSLALLGQEFWQSKFVSLKQLPKNSLNNETLAMINQNQQKQEELQQQQQQQSTKQYNRQQTRRHNSNSSESNQSKTSISMSPMPPMICSRRNTSDSASPTMPPTAGSNSQKISSPPPLPPKNPSMICDPQANSPLISSTKVIIADDSNQISSPKTSTIVEVHNNPTIKNHNNMPRLSSSRVPSYVPPPIPPRNRNSPNGSTPPPPPLPANGPPLLSLRTKKPHSNSNKALHDLLSPMSMTESEIEMAKFSLSHKIAPNILEVEEYKDDEISNNKSLTHRNYYNQMIQAHASSPIMIEEEIKNQQTPSPAPFPVQHSLLQASELQSLPCDAQQSSSIKCDVCTQTYDTNKNLFASNLQPQQGRITRANSSLSCFYMDPVDALVAIHQHQPKRHSDPELASNSQNTMDVESSLNHTFTMSHSLESLLENFRHRFS